MKIDLKTAIILGTLLFAGAGFYYKTTNDVENLSLKVKSFQTENRNIQKRLDSLNKRMFKINKKLRELKK